MRKALGALLALLCAISVLPVGTAAKKAAPSSNAVYSMEAEDSSVKKTNATVSTSDEYGWSGGKAVTVSSSGSIVFTGVSIRETGYYLLRIYYTSTDMADFFDIKVGGYSYELNMKRSEKTATAPDTAETVIYMEAGKNNLQFTTTWTAPALDRIEILPYGEPETVTGSTRAEADLSVSGNRASFSVKAEESGDYAVRMTVSAQGEASFTVSANGGRHIAKAACAGSDDIAYAIAVVSLKKGSNKISIDIPEGAVVRSAVTYPCVYLKGNGVSLVYDKAEGFYSVLGNGKTYICDAFAEMKIDDVGKKILSNQYDSREITVTELDDDFGKGTRLTVKSTGAGLQSMIQIFSVYEERQYILTNVSAEYSTVICSNRMSPLTVAADSGVSVTASSDDVFLEVPWDNDAWDEFELNKLNGGSFSHEVTALFNAASGEALVLGSVTHDTWKTGIEYYGRHNSVRYLTVYGGASRASSRDRWEHGYVYGKTVTSPTILIGVYGDWRNGMNDFAEANKIVTPSKIPYDSDAGTIFGYNAGGLDPAINFANMETISDYIYKNLQAYWETSESDKIYLNFDGGGGWEITVEENLTAFVEYCRENGQEVGGYCTPFFRWADTSLENLKKEKIAGCEYTTYDCLLRNADGELYGEIDGGYALDPTHPGTLQLAANRLNSFMKCGLTYIKIDFVNAGAVEGHYFDESITTGVQAYNYGMQKLVELIDGRMHINLSISPIFPGNYCDSRRISCDTYAHISSTEYELNSVTFGFWENILYRTDPDCTKLWDKGTSSASEARAQMIRTVVSGTHVIACDDFRDKSEEAQERFSTLYANEELIAVAKIGKCFMPLTTPTKNKSANVLYMQNDGYTYLAFFNYEKSGITLKAELKDYIKNTDGLEAVNLLTGETVQLNGTELSVRLGETDAVIFKIRSEALDRTDKPEVTDFTDSGRTVNSVLIIAAIVLVIAIVSGIVIVLRRKQKRRADAA